MKILAALRTNLQVFPAGVMYVDLRYGGATVQAFSVNISAGIIRHHAVPVLSSLAVPIWLMVDQREVVVIADVDTIPGVEIIVRATDGSSRVLPQAESAWAIDAGGITADLAACVSTLTKIGG